MKPIFSCQRCETEAYLVDVKGRPDHVRCPTCGRSHSFDELYAVFKKLAVEFVGQEAKKVIRTGRLRPNGVSKNAYGFIVKIEP